jgi:hypothetical protein
MARCLSIWPPGDAIPGHPGGNREPDPGHGRPAISAFPGPGMRSSHGALGGSDSELVVAASGAVGFLARSETVSDVLTCHDLAAEKRGHDLCAGEVSHRAGERVTVDDDEVGVVAGLE